MLRRNVLQTAGLRIIGLLCSLAVVPLTIDYLSSEVYGVWLTMINVLYWFAFFDVGLGNGMRNYLAAAISSGDYETGRAYLTSTLALLAAIAAVMGLVALPFILMMDFTAFFHTTAVGGEELRWAMLAAVVFTLVNFVVKNVGYIFVALQRYAMSDLLAVGGNVLALAIIYLLTLTTESHLFYVVLAFVGVPVAVYLLACIPIFVSYPQLRPSRRAFSFDLARPIVVKGLGFFLIQITSCLVIYGSSNVFILRSLGPEAVTTYGIAYKYFHMIAMAYTIVLAPMWNAYTDAKVKGDYPWVARTFRRALLLWAGTIVGGLVMFAGSGIFYELWVGQRVEVPWTVSLVTLAYITLYNLNNCVTYLLNGFNKIRVQVITSIVATAGYLLTVWLIGDAWGVCGIVGSMAVSYGVMALIHLYQCRLLISQKARGIWDK